MFRTLLFVLSSSNQIEEGTLLTPTGYDWLNTALAYLASYSPRIGNIDLNINQISQSITTFNQWQSCLGGALAAYRKTHIHDMKALSLTLKQRAHVERSEALFCNTSFFDCELLKSILVGDFYIKVIHLNKDVLLIQKVFITYCKGLKKHVSTLDDDTTKREIFFVITTVEKKLLPDLRQETVSEVWDDFCKLDFLIRRFFKNSLAPLNANCFDKSTEKTLLNKLQTLQASWYREIKKLYDLLRETDGTQCDFIQMKKNFLTKIDLKDMAQVMKANVVLENLIDDVRVAVQTQSWLEWLGACLFQFILKTLHSIVSCAHYVLRHFRKCPPAIIEEAVPERSAGSNENFVTKPSRMPLQQLKFCVDFFQQNTNNKGANTEREGTLQFT